MTLRVHLTPSQLDQELSPSDSYAKSVTSFYTYSTASPTQTINYLIFMNLKKLAKNMPLFLSDTKHLKDIWNA